MRKRLAWALLLALAACSDGPTHPPRSTTIVGAYSVVRLELIQGGDTADLQPSDTFAFTLGADWSVTGRVRAYPRWRRSGGYVVAADGDIDGMFGPLQGTNFGGGYYWMASPGTFSAHRWMDRTVWQRVGSDTLNLTWAGPHSHIRATAVRR
jgi:hypothetical protein